MFKEQHLDRVAHLVGLPLRHVLEHVARGKFEFAFLGGVVVRALADELEELEHFFARLGKPNRGVDDAAGDRSSEGVSHESSLNTRCAFSRRNFGQTLSRNGTSGISLKM